jgi:trimeric autotransporter adhesin
MKMKTPSVPIAIAVLFFWLLPKTQAVSPPPDGGYPGGNTAEGQNALFSLTTGGFNTAVGFFSLRSITAGSFNTAIGAGALDLNTGSENTATGAAALLLNTTGTQNTANGVDALALNNTGSQNTAVGDLALFHNTAGTFNSAIGQGALASNTIGDNNTAGGAGALFRNTIGTGNTADGFQALNFNDTGSGNTAIGYQALDHNTTGAANIALGLQAGHNLTSGVSNIDIGNLGEVGESGTIRIGTQALQTATYIAGIIGASVGNGLAVIIDSDGHLGTMVSSQRFKKEIKPMDQASQALFALKPVSFRYNKEIDPAGTSQLGLVAEDVEKVDPDLVVRDKEGKAYGVRYDQVNAMLLNEFLKEHRKVEEQGAAIARQRTDFQTKIDRLEGIIVRQERRLDEQAAQIERVSAQMQMDRSAAQMVAGK